MIQKQAKRHIIKDQRRQIDWLVARIGELEEDFNKVLAILEDSDAGADWRAKRAALTIRDIIAEGGNEK